MVPLEVLGPLFRDVADMYIEQTDEPFEDAEFISTWLQDDWQIFSERIETARDNRMQRMAIAILRAGGDPRESPDYGTLFVEQESLHLSIADLFYAGLDRPAIVVPPPEPEDIEAFAPSAVEIALGDLGTTYPCSRPLYRARPYDIGRRTPYAAHELEAPPPDRARAGRASPAGTSVLYVATNPATALLETRATPGQCVGLTTIKLVRPTRILNLVNLPYIKSPFRTENLRWRVEALGLLHAFGEELSKPVDPEEEETQYPISQEACAAIQAAGFDGVAYPSGRGSGHNVVFFDPRAGRPSRPIVVRVVDDDGGFEEIPTPL